MMDDERVLDPHSTVYWRAVQSGLWSSRSRTRLADVRRREEEEVRASERREELVEKRIKEERERLEAERREERRRRRRPRRVEAEAWKTGDTRGRKSTPVRTDPIPSTSPPSQTYQERWEHLLRTTNPIHVIDLPLPIHGLASHLSTLDERLDRLTRPAIRSFLLGGLEDPREKRLVLRKAYIWHPDRFQQRFGARIVEADRTAIEQIVNRIAGVINDLVLELEESRERTKQGKG